MFRIGGFPVDANPLVYTVWEGRAHPKGMGRTLVKNSGKRIASSESVEGRDMKSVMYFYNGVQGEEELHEDEALDELEQGKIIERAG